MPRDEVVEYLKSIDQHLTTVVQMLDLSLLSSKESLLSNALSVIGDSCKRAEVYLATDGVRGASQIAEIAAMKPSNVSAEQRILQEAGLVEPDHPLGSGYVYTKVRSYELLGLPERLRSLFGLGR